MNRFGRGIISPDISTFIRIRRCPLTWGRGSVILRILEVCFCCQIFVKRLNQHHFLTFIRRFIFTIMIITDLNVLYYRIGENDIETEWTIVLELEVLLDAFSNLFSFRQTIKDGIVVTLGIFLIIVIINKVASF